MSLLHKLFAEEWNKASNIHDSGGDTGKDELGFITVYINQDTGEEILLEIYKTRHKAIDYGFMNMPGIKAMCNCKVYFKVISEASKDEDVFIGTEEMMQKRVA